MLSDVNAPGHQHILLQQYTTHPLAYYTGMYEFTDILFYSSSVYAYYSSSKSVSSAGVLYCITRYDALSASIVGLGVMLFGDAESKERSVSLYVCTMFER